MFTNLKMLLNKYHITYRAIINHYIPKIDNWMEKNSVKTPNREDVITLRQKCLISVLFLISFFEYFV